MKKAMIIMNPSAGGEKAKEYEGRILEKFNSYFDEVDLRYTEGSGDATRFSSEASEKHYECIFAVGGDGTVNEAVSGIAEKEFRPKFGILPGGTGNLLAKVVGIPNDIDSAIDALDFENISEIDIGKSNDKYFCYMFSIGSVSEGIHNVDVKQKTKFGPLAYAVSTIKNIVADKSFEIKIESDSKTYEGKAAHIIVLLTEYFADRKIVGDEDEDGYANVLILKNSDFISKLNILPDLLSGAVEKNDNIEFFKARSLKISSMEGEVETDLDGDKGDYLPVEIKVLKNHLRIYC